MTKQLSFDDEAVAELEAAAGWYEARRQDLGLDFVAAIREALDNEIRILAIAHTSREPGFWRGR